MRKFVFLFAAWFSLLLSLGISLSAQDINRCGTMQYLQSQEEKHPGTIQRWMDANEAAEQWVKNHPSEPRNVMVIPVVVHVVYHTTIQNISNNQIESQIEVLNEDFNRLNADTFKTPSVWKPVAGGMQVQFCLAAYAPDGSDTNGITRTQTNSTSFDLGDSVKHSNQGGADAWPSSHYLNIWVCNLGNNTLGYTTLPGTASPGEDGIVVLYRAFGRVGTLTPPYNKGRTATHEVGHWLGLSHTFGDDGGSCTNDDGCNDTPKEADAVYGCPPFPLIDQCSGGPNGVMFMNYMDYTDDACMNIFTQCQDGKMIAVLNNPQLRQPILTSPAGCQGIQFNLDAAISSVAFPADTLNAQGFEPQVQLSNRGIDEITYVQINYNVDGQPPATYDYEGSLASQISTLVTLPVYFTGEGGHVFYAWTSNPNHGTDQFIYNDTSGAPFFVRSSQPKNTTIISVQQESPTDQPTIIVLNPSAAIMHLQVVNLLGQIIQEGDWPVSDNSSFTIDLSSEPNGLYFLRGKIGYDYVKKKIMVLRD